MMDKEKLRKADIFSGGVIIMIGLWIVSQALKMPMKDSWGGVQNVWFVSPAIFPLFVGAMISGLGLLLMRNAIKTVGWNGAVETLRWLKSPQFAAFLKTAPMMRFYAMIWLLFGFVYLNVPRVDFFLCSILFLFVFITMFYFDDEDLLKRLLVFYVLGTLLMIVLLAAGTTAALRSKIPYFEDILTLVFILAYAIFCFRLIQRRLSLRRKYTTSVILATAGPLIIGALFKYLLLVPMPTEGIVVVAMDAVRYMEF